MIHTEIGEIDRFDQANQVVSYAGLDPVVRESGDCRRPYHVREPRAGLRLTPGHGEWWLRERCRVRRVLYGVASRGIFLVDGVMNGLAALFLLVHLPRADVGLDRFRLSGVGTQWRDVLSRRILAFGLLNVGFAVAYA